ncbi:MAG: hypothetical protein HC897_00795 [Thermoanaerobaculia bacterium]|nr:hypothetical protein [Thermoanaerobaculia bacterium]
MAKQKPVERVSAPARGGRGSYWAEVLREWSQSGQTQVDFCRDRGVSLTSLRWWKWWLKASGPTAARAGVERCEKVRFVPVKVVASRVPPSVIERSASPSGCYEVELRGGDRLRVPADFEPEVLQRLIQTVEAARC